MAIGTLGLAARVAADPARPPGRGRRNRVIGYTTAGRVYKERWVARDEEARRKFGAYLARQRERVARERGLPYFTQSDLARAIGMTKGAISAIEGGTVHRPSDETMRRLARELGVELADLEREAPPKRNARGEGRHEALTDEQKDRLVALYQGGETIVDLALRFHRARVTIAKALHEREVRTRQGRPPEGPPRG